LDRIERASPYLGRPAEACPSLDRIERACPSPGRPAEPEPEIALRRLAGEFGPRQWRYSPAAQPWWSEACFSSGNPFLPRAAANQLHSNNILNFEKTSAHGRAAKAVMRALSPTCQDGKGDRPRNSRVIPTARRR